MIASYSFDVSMVTAVLTVTPVNGGERLRTIRGEDARIYL